MTLKEATAVIGNATINANKKRDLDAALARRREVLDNLEVSHDGYERPVLQRITGWIRSVDCASTGRIIWSIRRTSYVY